MRNRLRFVAIILVLMFVIIGITSISIGCKNKKTYEVVFDIGEFNTETPASLTVTDGQQISVPFLDCLPTVGFEFVWYTDEERTVIFDFSQPINSNKILYLGERGIIYNISYENVDEAWFDITSLPTQYRAGEVTALPYPKETAPQKGYYEGNWHIQKKDIGYEIGELEYGDITLKFVIDPIEYDIYYTNINRIDLNDNDYFYLDYIINPNPSVYRITDGVITLKPLTLKADCPYPLREFSHWERVKAPDNIRDPELIEEFDIDAFEKSFYLRAVWKAID